MATSYSALSVKDQVQLMYVAYFGRAGDPAGMNHWIDDINVNHFTIEQVGDTFALQSEAKGLYSYLAYPNLGDPTAFVTAIYNNLFERAPDQAGLNYWVDRLTGTNTNLTNPNGEHISAGTMIAAIINGAYASTGTNHANDVASMANKITVADYFTQKLIDNNITWDPATMRDDAAACIANVTWDSATIATGENTANASVNAFVGTSGQTFTLTTSVDNVVGTAGNDTFLGDNTSANAADTLNGGAGTDTLKLYNTVNLGNLSGIENVYINGSTGAVNVSSNADVTSLTIDNIDVDVTTPPSYTLSATQTLTLQNVVDGDVGNNDGVEVNAAASVTAQTLKLNKVGDTAGNDVNIDINGTGVATLNVKGTGSASRVSIENTGTAIRTLNISGDAAVEIQTNAASNNVGALATVINITNTAGATVTSSVATNTTAGLTITAAGGADKVTLDQASGANALTNKVAVDLGAGNDTLVISKLTAATDIADGASFKGGDGTDTLKLFDGDIIDTTRGKLFSGFEIVDIGGAQATTNLDLSLLAANNNISTLKLSAANTGAVSVTNLAETAGVLINAATGANLTINQKDSGAGSPDDTITVTYDSKTSIGAQTGTTTIADVETVNLKVTSTGTNITHEVTNLVVDNATKVTVDASTAAVDIKGGFSAKSLVLLDASASVKSVSIALNDAYTATAGVAVKGGAGNDNLDFTGATTSAAAATDLDFLITGNGGADVITLAGVTGGVDRIVYLAQGDSTYAKYDSISNFDATATSAQDLLDFKAFGFTGNQQGVKDFGTSTAISLAADGSVTVASASMANFFVDTGLARGVAAWDSGSDVFVFVDANKDGNFSYDADLVIKLSGVASSTDITATDIVFA